MDVLRVLRPALYLPRCGCTRVHGWQMKLTYTNAAFTHHGVPMAGVPVVLNDDMKIAEGPQRWVFYIALDRGRTRSRATWRSYAEALYDWLQTCQANGWAWDEIEPTGAERGMQSASREA